MINFILNKKKLVNTKTYNVIILVRKLELKKIKKLLYKDIGLKKTLLTLFLYFRFLDFLQKLY